jgi:hypothetical protein
MFFPGLRTAKKTLFLAVPAPYPQSPCIIFGDSV